MTIDRVKTEEEKSKRGKLKIFLGYAAGVGKTFAMLESALQRMKEVAHCRGTGGNAWTSGN